MNQQDVVKRVIQQLMSQVPGLGPLMSELMGPAMASWISRTTSADNAFIWPGSGSSMHRAAFEYAEGVRGTAFDRAKKVTANDLKLRALEDMHRMIDPGLSDKELRQKAENSDGNFLDPFNLLYTFTDPYKLQEGFKQAKNTASILHRRQGIADISGSHYAREISRAIYGTAKEDSRDGIIHDILDNPSNYGNLSVAGVMSIGKELAATDPTGFASMDKTGKMRFDADRFKNTVRDMSKALEPWTAVFGNDIPKLLNQLEALTGFSIGGLSAGDVKAMGSRITSIAYATGATAQHIAAYKDALAGSLVDPTMSNRSILGAGALAGDLTLGMANTSLNYITQQEFQNTTAKFFAGSSRSMYSERYALAYAKWAADQGSGYDTSIDAFNKALNSRLAEGYNDHEALMATAGVNSINDLSVYKNTDKYLHARKTGASDRATRAAINANVIDSLKRNYNKSTYSKYNSDVAKWLSSLDNNEVNRIIGGSKQGLINEIIKQADVSEQEATIIATDLQSAGRKAYSGVTGNSWTLEESNAYFAQSYNYNKNNEIASRAEAFSNAISEISTTGGLWGLLEKARESGKGGIELRDAIKAYTGGSDMLEAFVMAQKGMDKDYIKQHEKTFLSGMNFIRNNYAEISNADRYGNLYEKLIGTDRKEQLEAYKTVAELDKVNDKALTNMSDEEMSELVSYLSTKENRGKGNVAKDWLIDRKIGAAVGNILGDSGESLSDEEGSVRDIINEIIKEDTSSVVDFRNKFKDRIKNDNIDDTKQLEIYDKIESASKLGDVDGVDPMYKISQALENLPDLLNRIANGLSNFSNNISSK